MEKRILIRVLCILILKTFCFSTDTFARKNGYIQPVNQQQDWYSMKQNPAVVLVKVTDVNYPYYYCKGIVNGKEAYIEAITKKKHLSADSIPKSYQKIEKGKYYLMALAFPLYPLIYYLPVNYADVTVVSDKGKKIKAEKIVHSPPKMYVAINMLNCYIRPIEASDLKELPQRPKAKSNIPDDWLWPD